VLGRRRDRSADNLKAVVRVAASVLKDSSMLQFRVSEIGGEENLRQLVGKVSIAYGHNVRANIMSGLVTLYGDDIDFAAKDVVVMRFEGKSGISGR